MNNKAQMQKVGVFILVFVGIIVSLALFEGSLTSIGTATNTNTVTNALITFPNTATSPYVLSGQAVSSVVVTNRTGGEVVSSGNYTIENYDLSASGTLQATISNLTGQYAGTPVNISYVYEPLGYAKDSSSRTMITLIVIFSSLAVAVYVLSQMLDVDLMAMIKR